MSSHCTISNIWGWVFLSSQLAGCGEPPHKSEGSPALGRELGSLVPASRDIICQYSRCGSSQEVHLPGWRALKTLAWARESFGFLLGTTYKEETIIVCNQIMEIQYWIQDCNCILSSYPGWTELWKKCIYESYILCIQTYVLICSCKKLKVAKLEI